jgi:hypothetical protein
MVARAPIGRSPSNTSNPADADPAAAYSVSSKASHFSGTKAAS